MFTHICFDVQDVLEHALNGDKTMEEIADEWNQAWTYAPSDRSDTYCQSIIQLHQFQN